MMTTEQRRAAYRARVNVHPVCRMRTNNAVPTDCKVCAMVEAYRERREMYRDELEQSDPQNLRERPIFVPTFRWWLRVYEWPTAPDVDTTAGGGSDVDSLAYLDVWSVAA